MVINEGVPLISDGLVLEMNRKLREYVVCRFESENHEQMIVGMGKAMKCTRFWLKKHGLIADGFFSEMYYKSKSNIVYAVLWIPFKKRG
ncbi:hypothetical protein [Ruminiclostridium cellobioparum]|uniref:hypothetical protein n=1 Tax=Ruminiclostridium cellobioparum TaxID=29355 RepID=UPI0028B026D9|nr:hypothetical protein [Ruminiclostridium cellobioparum]